jgi:hypothetical protein
MRILSHWLCILLVTSGILQTALVAHASVVTTIATFEAENLLLPSTGPPLVAISVARSNGGGIYTNQYTGTAGSSGLLRTVVAVPVNIMRDGVSYSTVGGPSSTPGSETNLVAFIGLEGSLIAPGTASFSAGRALIYETSPFGFEPRDPSSWGFASGTPLAEFALAPPETVLPGGGGAFTTIAAPVPGSDVNLSILDGLTIGDTDFQFLFQEDSPAALTTATTGDNWMRDLFNPFAPDPISWEGLLVEGEQDLDQAASGRSISGGFTLDAADLAVLNSIAGAAGLADLLGLGTGFATGFGVGGGGPTTDYYIDLGMLPPAAGLEGDLYANTAEFNAYPVAASIPEPTTILVWGCLAMFASLAASRRHR